MNIEKILKEVLAYFTEKLLNNPRLLYFWSKEGGNICVYFENQTQQYYDENLSTKDVSKKWILTVHLIKVIPQLYGI